MMVVVELALSRIQVHYGLQEFWMELFVQDEVSIGENLVEKSQSLVMIEPQIVTNMDHEKRYIQTIRLQ